MLYRNPTSRGLLYAAAAAVLLLLPACDDGRHPASPSLAAEPLPLSTTTGDARGCAFSGVVRESPGNFLSRGIVRESTSGSRLTDATIEVVSGPYAGEKDTTRHDGSYGLSVRDTVTVRASKPGYLSQEATVTVTAPGGAAYDFSLVSRQ